MCQMCKAVDRGKIYPFQLMVLKVLDNHRLRKKKTSSKPFTSYTRISPKGSCWAKRKIFKYKTFKQRHGRKSSEPMTRFDT